MRATLAQMCTTQPHTHTFYTQTGGPPPPRNQPGLLFLPSTTQPLSTFEHLLPSTVDTMPPRAAGKLPHISYTNPSPHAAPTAHPRNPSITPILLRLKLRVRRPAPPLSSTINPNSPYQHSRSAQPPQAILNTKHRTIPPCPSPLPHLPPAPA